MNEPTTTFGSNEVARRIAKTLSRVTTHKLRGVASDLGLDVGDEGTGDKEERVMVGLDGLDRKTLGSCAQRVGEKFKDFELEEVGYALLEEDEPRITELTRRNVAKCLGHDLAGERAILHLVGELWPIDTMIDTKVDFFTGRSLADEIDQHMVRNPEDWSTEKLFEQLGALKCSRTRFGRLLEAAVHPLSRQGDEQTHVVDEINRALRPDGYHLDIIDEVSGCPVYGLTPIRRGVAGAPKNLIFASIGFKPELGFSDAVNNDIVILSNADDCLIYDRPIRLDGLLWSELIAWWQARESIDDSAAARKSLGARLRASLATDGERKLFDWYFRQFNSKLKERLPALIPQVYLHYDPKSLKELRLRDPLNPKRFPRQRMDFLLLLAGRVRVVLEVDGTRHFSREKKIDGKQFREADLDVYAEMVAADRDLRLSGYEIFRFGTNELERPGPEAPALIKQFFDRLFTLHPPA